MNKFTFMILFVLFLMPSFLYAGAEDIQITGEWRLSHLGYQMDNMFYGDRTWAVFNKDNTKVMMYENFDYTHPTYGTTGRGLVVGKISNLKTWTTLAEYQSAAKPLSDTTSGVRRETLPTAVYWSPFAGEENIIYAPHYSGSNCTYLKKLDVGDWLDGGATPSWTNVISVATGTTECRNMRCWAYTSNNELICSLNNEVFSTNVNGVYGYIINLQTPSKTNITSWSTRCSDMSYVDNWPMVSSHGHASRKPSDGDTAIVRGNCAQSDLGGSLLCIRNLNTCSSTDYTGQPICNHFSWKSDDDWSICSDASGTYTSPGLYNSNIRQLYPATREYITVKTQSTARFWNDGIGSGDVNFSALPLATLSHEGGKLVYTSTLGKYSYDDYSKKGSTPWDMVSLNLIEFTTGAGSDTENPALPSPEGFTATKNATNPTSQIDLAWSACTDNVGVTNYKIYRCTCSDEDCDPTCSPTTEITSLAVTSYFDNIGISPNTAYMYGAKCYDAAGNNSTYATTPWAKTDALASSDYTFLKKPSNITITIDGIMMPEEWGIANVLTITATAGGNVLKVYGLWDNTYLYLGMFINDESQKVLSSSTQNDDDQWAWNSIEVLISMNSGTGGTSDPDSPYMTSTDFHWIVDTNGYIWDGQGDDGDPTNPTSVWDCATCTIAKRIYDDRFTVELRIPWAEIGSAPSDNTTKTMSFVINDFDWYTIITNPDGTTSQIKNQYWYMWGGYTNAFENESKWKTVTFSGTYASTMGKMTLSESGTGSISW